MPHLTRIVAGVALAAVVVVLGAGAAHAVWADRRAFDAGAIATGQAAIVSVTPAGWTKGSAPLGPDHRLMPGDVVTATFPVEVLVTGTTMTPALDLSGWTLPAGLIGAVRVSIDHEPFSPSPDRQAVSVTVTLTVADDARLMNDRIDFSNAVVVLDSGRVWFDVHPAALGEIRFGANDNSDLCFGGVKPDADGSCPAPGDSGIPPVVTTRPPVCSGLDETGFDVGWVRVQQIPEATVGGQSGRLTELSLTTDFGPDDVSATLTVELPSAWFAIADAPPFSDLRLFVNGLQFERVGSSWVGEIAVRPGRTTLNIQLLFNRSTGNGNVYLYPAWMLATLKTTTATDAGQYDTYAQALTVTSGYAQGSPPNSCPAGSGWTLPPGLILNHDGSPMARSGVNDDGLTTD
jgi:alternate signal-mediated exported protein